MIDRVKQLSPFFLGWKPWIKMISGFGLVLFFIYVIGPLGLKLQLVGKMADVIAQNDIRPTALFYTDLESFAEAEAAMRNRLENRRSLD